jgi:hypothetical protein
MDQIATSHHLPDSIATDESVEGTLRPFTQEAVPATSGSFG